MRNSPRPPAPPEVFDTAGTLLSTSCANDVNLEDIARLVGHSGTAVTERVYRHEIRPSLTQGAEIMDHLFGSSSQEGSNS